MNYCLLISSWFYKRKIIKRHDRQQLTIHMCVVELLITGFSNWLICMDHWNPLVHRLIAQRPFKSSLNFCIPHFLRNISTWFVQKCFNQTITMEHLVSYVLHPSYKGAKLSPDQLIIVTDSVTLGNFFLWKKGFLPSKNPFLPIGREEIPFFREETQPWSQYIPAELLSRQVDW